METQGPDGVKNPGTQIEVSVISNEGDPLQGWSVVYEKPRWSWDTQYGWIYIGPWRPWSFLLQWWYGR